MRHTLVIAPALLLVGVVPARAQFGSGIVFDPTQSVHAAQQILEANQLYTTTVATTQNVISAYNLAQRMASAPQALYTSYSNLGRQQWAQIDNAANTYGNTQPWIAAATSGYGAVPGTQAAGVPDTHRVSGYSQLAPTGQQQLAAHGATADLGDAANATSLRTMGTVRANAYEREADIAALEQASHSIDPTQQTQMATLQRINQALLIQLRTQQETNQMLQAQGLQQVVGQKLQQDDIKSLLQAADGFEANYNSKAGAETNESVSRALHY